MNIKCSLDCSQTICIICVRISVGKFLPRRPTPHSTKQLPHVVHPPPTHHPPTTHPPPTDHPTTPVQQCSSTYGSIPVREEHLVGPRVLRTRSPARNAGRFVCSRAPRRLGERASRHPPSTYYLWPIVRRTYLVPGMRYLQ